MKRIVTIQDLSCVGRCSLTVALPILSAMGIETAVLPTAVLSNHTAFSNFTFRDLTDDIVPISKRWEAEGMTFDAIYTGYIGTEHQIDVIADFIDRFKLKKKETLVVVDPAMADNGTLYKGLPRTFSGAIRRLCRKADVIIPNRTEAALLLDRPYPNEDTEEALRGIPKELTEALDIDCAVLTGVSRGGRELGAAAYSRRTDTYEYHGGIWYPENFLGTGDIFASVLTGALVRGRGMPEALSLAVDFTSECARLTLADPDHRWYGVNFEQALPSLTDVVRKWK